MGSIFIFLRRLFQHNIKENFFNLKLNFTEQGKTLTDMNQSGFH